MVLQSTTIYTIAELLEEVAERKPRVIVISYGINDVGLYHDDGVEKYMEDFAGLIKDLEEAVPGVTVYVNSIVPCLESEYERARNWMAIPAWNAYIKNYCAEHGIRYIDVTDLAMPIGIFILMTAYIYRKNFIRIGALRSRHRLSAIFQCVNAGYFYYEDKEHPFYGNPDYTGGRTDLCHSFFRISEKQYIQGAGGRSL